MNYAPKVWASSFITAIFTTAVVLAGLVYWMFHAPSGRGWLSGFLMLFGLWIAVGGVIGLWLITGFIMMIVSAFAYAAYLFIGGVVAAAFLVGLVTDAKFRLEGWGIYLSIFHGATTSLAHVFWTRQAARLAKANTRQIDAPKLTDDGRQ